MKNFISIRTNLVLILSTLLMSTYSINSFAGTTTTRKEAAKVVKKDCVSCTPELAMGNPLEGNASAKLVVAMASTASISQEEANFNSYLNVYCMTITHLGGVNNFQNDLIEPMKKTSGSDEVMNRYWQAPGCDPQQIGGTKSPLVHLVAENPTDRNAYLIALQKYYNDKNDKVTFTKILNAKNTRGQTLLDYMNYMFLDKVYMKEEEKPLNDLYKFLCDNGAVFSAYNKKCPAEYLTIKE